MLTCFNKPANTMSATIVVLETLMSACLGIPNHGAVPGSGFTAVFPHVETSPANAAICDAHIA